MANIMVNEACNLHCPYCFAGEFVNRDPKEMSFEDFRTALDFVLSDKTERQVGIIGGEPLLYSHIEEALRLALDDPRTDPVMLYTNAVALERLPAEILESSKFRMLVNCNPPEDMGEKAFEKMRQNLLRFKDDHFGEGRFRLSVNIYKEDFDYSYVIPLVQEMGFDVIRLSVSVPAGGLLGGSDGFCSDDGPGGGDEPGGGDGTGGGDRTGGTVELGMTDEPGGDDGPGGADGGGGLGVANGTGGAVELGMTDEPVGDDGPGGIDEPGVAGGKSPLEYFRAMKPVAMAFVGDMLRCGVITGFDCNFLPGCVLTEEEHDGVLAAKEVFYSALHRNYSRTFWQRAILCELNNCTPVIDVLPDLTAIRCFGLSEYTKRDIRDFRDIGELRRYYINTVDRPACGIWASDECKDCYNRESGECSCGCLLFKAGQLF